MCTGDDVGLLYFAFASEILIFWGAGGGRGIKVIEMSIITKESTHASGQPDVTLSVCGFGWGWGIYTYIYSNH